MPSFPPRRRVHSVVLVANKRPAVYEEILDVDTPLVTFLGDESNGHIMLDSLGQSIYRTLVHVVPGCVGARRPTGCSRTEAIEGSARCPKLHKQCRVLICQGFLVRLHLSTRPKRKVGCHLPKWIQQL